jgi:putative peptidoglycan lipid II flippase
MSINGGDIQNKLPGLGSRPTHSLLFSTVLMMLGLMLSKITGQLREILIVPIFGIGEISDAYIIGFMVPDLFFQLLVGGAIQAVITPTLSAAIERGQEKKAWRSVSILINISAVIMVDQQWKATGDP